MYIQQWLILNNFRTFDQLFEMAAEIGVEFYNLYVSLFVSIYSQEKYKDETIAACQ